MTAYRSVTDAERDRLTNKRLSPAKPSDGDLECVKVVKVSVKVVKVSVWVFKFVADAQMGSSKK